MKVFIVGAGPAGLYFAILMKRLDPSHEITIVERDGPNDTFGWGIVFSDQTFAYLEASDPPSCRRIVERAATWDNVDVVHRGRRISIRGNQFSGIARIAFLNVLHRRCEELGIAIRFRTTVTGPAEIPPCDLLVGADGANSTIRRWHAAAFEPALELGANKYIWLGTRRLFHGLTLIFHDTPAGAFAAHAYRFDSTTSTFIVECSQATWEAAGFPAQSEADTRRPLEEIFADDLGGEPLLTNNFVKWISFLHVRNRRWWHGRTVLLGDALHTAHFSIGSGTKLALGDAIALAQAFAAHHDAEAALDAFDRDRRPVVEAYQDAARDSQAWFERMHEYLHLDLLPFAYRVMTRSRKIDYAKLRARDPEFVDAYESSRAI